MTETKLGHGDHWLAALHENDPRLRDALAVPIDASERLALHRTPLNDALDMVQVTRARRLVTAYPEPRATALIRGRPRELQLWENRAEGWLTIEHEGAGALTVFLTDLAEAAPRYAAAGTRAGIELEIAGLAYQLHRSTAKAPARLQPASRTDARFLPDDHAFDADVIDARAAGWGPAEDADGGGASAKRRAGGSVRAAGEGEVLDLAFHGDLAFPVAWRERALVEPGDRVAGYLWLTARLPPLERERAVSKGS